MFRPKTTPLVLLIAALVAPLSLGAAETGASEPMLKGNTLNGWKKFGGTKWTVRDGVIGAGPGGGVLVYEEPLDDYVFECDFKVAKGGNGGIYVRSKPESQNQNPRYEMQIWDSEKAVGHRTGDFLYVHMARKWASKPTEWNSLRLTSVGPRHQVLLNGQVILDAVDFGKLRGCLALQAHSSGKVPYIWYRNPRLRKLPKGTWPWPKTRPRVLVLVSKRDGPGKTHDRIGAAIENALAARFDVTWAADPRVLDPPHVNDYDVILLHGPDEKARTKWPGAERRQRLAERVRAGRGLIVLHSTFTGSKGGWAAFPELAGAAWRADAQGAAKGADLMVRPQMKAHPITAGLHPFQLHDDIRRVAGPLDGAATPLLYLHSGGSRHVVAWCSQAGKGRTFCASLGGSEAAITNPYVRLLLANACAWVTPRPAAK